MDRRSAGTRRAEAHRLDRPMTREIPTPCEPIVSVVIANYNGARYVAEAIASAQRQSLRHIEIIVSDDSSSDDSVGIIRGLMAQDPRIKLIRSEQNRGPGAARNKALALARGEWIAIMDSDDLMHPERLATLMEMAQRDEADIVADDLLMFDADNAEPPRALLQGRWARAPFWLDSVRFVRLNHLYGAGPVLGYLKPIFRASAFKRFGLGYDESLPVAEDYHLLLRMLTVGMTMRVYPLLLYFYRRHEASTSHRLSGRALAALKQADRRALAEDRLWDPDLLAAMKARSGSLETADKFGRLLGAAKHGEWLACAIAVLQRPQVFLLLWMPVWARLRRRFRPRSVAATSDRVQLCIVSRQRLVGRTSGSSAYLLDLARAIDRRGVDVHFVAPSPVTMGRQPYLRLSGDVHFFSSYRVRGTLRVGDYLFSTDPRRYLRGALGLIDRTLVRFGVTKRCHFNPDPYSVAEPLTREDQLFLARYSGAVGDFLLADYCFLTECFPYALRPDAATAVVMHDRFSARTGQFGALAGPDSVALLTDEEECKRLALADIVVAIQAEEANWARRRLRNREIILAPMAAHPVAAPQTGRDDLVLFVGSAAAPNVDGVKWFLEACWPKIRARNPGASFHVAGSVCQALGPAPEGVRFLGFVDELAPLYERAGVVVSPLRAGSGLKIKFIEALSHGKAVVGTPKTLQGVERLLSNCLCIEEAAEGFAGAVTGLLRDRSKRFHLANQALDAIARHFSPQSCYGALVDRIAGAKEGIIYESAKCVAQA
jgi:GT2 family glycosyltransferase/glycosyltransferase involved in cell wall biosynthesis